MNGQAIAGMAWRDIAASAYRAHVANVQSLRADLMPEWDDLPNAVKTAWEAAARQVGHCIGCRKAGDESSWAGWMPSESKR